MASVFPSNHPLVHQKLTDLRDVRTGPAEFRRLVRCLAMLLAQEATADLPTRGIEVTTPMGLAPGKVLADRVAIVPILRAGLGMAEGVLDLIPEAEVWHIGLYRDERSLQPVPYYNKLSPTPRFTLALVVDPMLATGGSSVHACRLLKSSGADRIRLISLLAAPEGLARMAEAMPEVPIHVGAVDERLNDVGFICPGLGDAGDRQFGTA